jgi:hypothetical protein
MYKILSKTAPNLKKKVNLIYFLLQGDAFTWWMGVKSTITTWQNAEKAVRPASSSASDLSNDL